ncbi:pyridoxal 5'-phosphate synthase [Herbiconiux sp. L3-i23]|uniref:pyridoxine/pyridoxamine 5'-phosphate oxidase n=1 Tax=Herbiconiux sp. L3-i23 TaxID=2905871 RepID=UPI00205E54DB|nr:pyridoxal 5'-phosphate synthase [Herbiconiux sp. L3-i23]BDI21975.1 pyridoxamine 5'-phosphate oxidase [Herbiconiux sp. L3-i23]
MPASSGPSSEPTLRDRIAALRMPDSAAPAFDPDDAPAEPFELLEQWLVAAIDGGVAAPHAMTLATTSTTGAPAARTVLLQDVADGALRFASSADSPKGEDIAADPRAAVVLHWREQHRQVRVIGRVDAAPREVSDADFLARPATARAGIIAGRQSAPLPARAEVDGSIAGARELIAVNPLFVPPSWTVYLLVARSIEFWQGPPGKGQQRLRYTGDDGSWSRQRLWP